MEMSVIEVANQGFYGGTLWGRDASGTTHRAMPLNAMHLRFDFERR